VKSLRQIAACLVFLLMWSAVVTATSQVNEEAAVSAAKDWLGEIDKGNYAASWRSAASFFRNAVTKEQWKQSLDAYRKPLGKLIARKIKSLSYKTSLPGAPDGRYVVIQFQTKFENKRRAVETVTPMMDDDGKWRVSGYIIK
jgi:hypothetical protein